MCSIPQLSLDFSAPRNTKRCSLCGISKDHTEFHLMGRSNARRECKECWNTKKRKEYDAEETRWRYIERKYKVSRQWYKETLIKQGGVCAICKQLDTTLFYGKPSELAVDHCHATGKVRGLLCRECNTALARIDRYGEQWANNAVEYVKSNS